MNHITFIIPAFNEEKTIGNVIEKIPYKELKERGFRVEVIVVDDGSNDNTEKIALSKGAFVIKHKKNEGKGIAVYNAFKNLSQKSEFVVMIDADDTYDPRESVKFIDLLKKNSCDVVIGSRFQGKIEKGAFSAINKFGNIFFTFLVKFAYNIKISDSCSGFIAWKRNVVDDLLKFCRGDGFSIEMEMLTKTKKLNYEIRTVPISYRKRNYGKSTLHPLEDGSKIFFTLLKNLWWKPKEGYIN